MGPPVACDSVCLSCRQGLWAAIVFSVVIGAFYPAAEAFPTVGIPVMVAVQSQEGPSPPFISSRALCLLAPIGRSPITFQTS